MAIEPPSASPNATERPARRSLLVGLGAGVSGLAIGGLAGRETRRGEVSANEQELRDDAFHGSFGMWPIIWSVPVTTNTIALTFDDGPDPEFTPKVLDTLRRYDAKATFMMMGWNVEHHQELAKRVVAEGHEVGNHTWSHDDLAKTDPATVESELRLGREAIERVCGQPVNYFRPPRGELSGVAARYAAQSKQSILMWTINGGAHLERTSDQVRDHLVASVQPGYIVDLHDGIGRGTFSRTATFARRLIEKRSLEVAALPAVLEALSARGVRFLTVSQLLAEPRS